MTVEAHPAQLGWLDLREPADAAARAGELVDLLRRRLPATGRLVIHDLGCGTGSMGRWLAPLLPGPQHWVLHDRDADLLDLAAATLPGRGRRRGPVTVETRRPTSPGCSPADLAGATLVTASALLDMLTAEELARAGRRLRRRRLPGAADPVGGRSGRLAPGGSAGRPRRRRVRRPPAAYASTRPPARAGRRRGRRRRRSAGAGPR